ncbi:anaerobic selenocysteine-containing dehydrogenase [Desulfobaculum xiamenense]|uniref:Anaerobic selenocysteine-containing dehydrogenase n=1 Tax=Desulfobaculum xiamenense TaxID=995050 RepID=A0A846QJN9_9BACT|nr:molybdopterin-dependent oxidoreductase [Desulfobaculum xiamenense]NJB68438.1 anaerobic selenocysteine-containing dehydrogenase [Desulfobaculum xiamenense]
MGYPIAMKNEKRITACTLDCPDTCSLAVSCREDGSLSFTGNPDHPFTRGFICPKTARFCERLTHPDRITQPLVREGANYWPVSWDDAFRLIAKRIDRLRSRPESILHVRGYGYRGVLADASKWFFGKLGASTTCGSPCDSAGMAAFEEDFGALAQNDIHDLGNAARIVNWGRDLSRSSVHLAAIVRNARKGGAKVLSISPGGDGNADFSDHMVRIRPGTDRFLAAALCMGLADAGVADEVADRCANFEEFRGLLAGLDLGELLGACDVAPEDYARLLRWYAADGPTATLVGWGLQRYLNGGENVRFIDAVATLSGNMGISGGGSYYGHSSGRNFIKWAARDVAPAPRALPVHDIGRAIIEADPPIEMIWVDGVNLINQLPAGDVTAEAFGRCGFVVAVEAFFTDTALRADLILPCALMAEREDVVGSSLHDWVNWSAKVLDPPGEARCDWDILAELGSRLAEPIIMPDREEALRTALDSPALHATPEELRAAGFLKASWPQVAFEGMCFAHPDGLCRLPDVLSPEPDAHAKYPCRLLTLVSRRAIHSQIPVDEDPEALEAFVSPANPCVVGLDTSVPVYAATPRGRVAVRVRFDETIHPSAVIVRRGGWMRHGRSLNPIIAPMETDRGGGTAYYSQCVRLEN